MSASTPSCQSGAAPTSPARRRTRLASPPAWASTRRAANGPTWRSERCWGRPVPCARGPRASGRARQPGDEAGTRSSRLAVAIALARRLASAAVVGVDGAVAGRVTRRHLGRRLGRRLASCRLGPAAFTIEPGGDIGRLGGLGNLAADPEHEQADHVLARLLPARAGAPLEDALVVGCHLEGSAPRPW